MVMRDVKESLISASEVLSLPAFLQSLCISVDIYLVLNEIRSCQTAASILPYCINIMYHPQRNTL